MFNLGILCMTLGVKQLLVEDDDRLVPDFVSAMKRHSTGDWGDIPPEDAAANDRALQEGTRLFSEYEIGGRKVWIITEADRSATTLLLPEEYWP